MVFTDRHGGVSIGPYASLNLGDRVGDEPRSVAENRRRLAAALDGAPDDPRAWVWLHQVHGNRVVAVDRAPGAPPEADGAVTARLDLPLVACAADCAPLALVAEGAIGVVHAGWAGLEAGVVEAGARAVRAAGGAVHGVLGPCARAESYEFGADLLVRLTNRFGADVAARTADGRPAFDLPEAVRVALDREGASLDDVAIDTVSSADHFSYRRDGTTGRHAVVVMQ